MGHYRKKPVTIEAVRFDGCDWVDDAVDGAGRPAFDGSLGPFPNWLTEALAKGEDKPGGVYGTIDGSLAVNTLEGTIFGVPGDWLIRGVEGELYPCKPHIFAATYDPLDDAPATGLAGQVEQALTVGRTELAGGAQ